MSHTNSFPTRWRATTITTLAAAAMLLDCAPPQAFAHTRGAFASFVAPVAVGVAASMFVPENALSVFSVLGFGLVLGLKHAVEADHLAAVSTIASERRSILEASMVGGLWGIGHTAALLVAGAVVLLLRVRIPPRAELALEFCVALMLVALGAGALWKLLRGGRMHLHAHEHGGRWHVHPHVHDAAPEPERHTHHGLRLGARPVLVGMVHGLAGSAALMLLVLSSISSPLLGFGYILVFGAGSIGGMMLMSTLVGLPVYLTSRRWTRANLALRGAAGVFSLAFGLSMVYQIGIVGNLFR